MQIPARIFLIHATPLAIPAINSSFKNLWPEAKLSNLLDDSLPSDLHQAGSVDSALTRRFIFLATYAKEAGADGIVFTCSAFGSAIDACKKEIQIPVLRPNEAMIEEAFNHGERIALVATFEPAIASLTKEIREFASSINRLVQISPVFVPLALAAAQAGDSATHDELISKACAEVKGVDVICFSQFSMTAAAESSAKCSGKKVLTTPDSAVRLIKKMLANATDR